MGQFIKSTKLICGSPLYNVMFCKGYFRFGFLAARCSLLLESDLDSLLPADTWAVLGIRAPQTLS